MNYIDRPSFPLLQLISRMAINSPLAKADDSSCFPPGNLSVPLTFYDKCVTVFEVMQ